MQVNFNISSDLWRQSRDAAGRISLHFCLASPLWKNHGNVFDASRRAKVNDGKLEIVSNQLIKWTTNTRISWGHTMNLPFSARSSSPASPDVSLYNIKALIKLD